MPLMEVDFEDVQGPIPAGTLVAFEITGAETKETQTDHSDMIVWTFTVFAPDEFAGRKLYRMDNLANRRMLKDSAGNPTDKPDVNAGKQARYYLQQFLTNVKAPYNPKNFDTEQAMHCKGTTKVKIEKFGDRDVNRPGDVMPFEG